MTRYTHLQHEARELGCTLTKVRPYIGAMRASYYIHLKDGRIRPAFTLDEIEGVLWNEHRRQTGYYSHGHKDLMRNPLRD